MRKGINYDYSISLIRLVAMSFIIICHIMQFFENELALWFNVGVQIFLCMSGFLYGKQGVINNVWEFYKKNALKILIDYYVVIIPIILMFLLVFPEKLSIVLIVKVLLTCGKLEGGGHLWYIPYCLLCYLMTPLLLRYFDSCKNRQIIKCFLFLCVPVIVLAEVLQLNSAWFICYILGFLLGSISTYENSKLYNQFSFVIAGGCILLNSIQIILDYVLKLELNGVLARLYIRYCHYAHVTLGVALFIVLKSIFFRLFKNGYSSSIKKLCLYSDKYSYDIYLVHQFVILGPFSLMQFTEIIGINLMLILGIIVVSAIIVNFISDYIRSKLKIVMHI